MDIICLNCTDLGNGFKIQNRDSIVNNEEENLRIYTIGHSNMESARLVDLLHQFGIQLLVDVRSSPYSQYNPQFNREVLAVYLERYHIDYAYMGDVLGGRPKSPDCYKAKVLPAEKADFLKLVDYPAVMQKEYFKRGIDSLIEMACNQTTAIMCSEEDPARCHRHHLVSRYLMTQEIEAVHIRGDGNLVNARQIPNLSEAPLAEQPALFK